ncbi:MAG: S41 family peptidase [Bacteroidia bacterium]
MRRKYNYTYPLMVGLLIALGMFIGARFNPGVEPGKYKKPSAKLEDAWKYITGSYVDTLNEEEMAEEAIRGMLEHLDPHSAYIPAKDLQEINEPLEGNFEGIGIEFNILNDTIVVVSPIAGGPSEALGIRAGDKIIKIENTSVAGEEISNEDVIGKLRGNKGTQVNITIYRPSAREEIEYKITRDKIPIYSVDASYMAAPSVGYIKISRFSRTTLAEFDDAMKELKGKGMESLILDLRGNPGGYLNAAINLADEFLPEDKLVVYTEGRAKPRQTYNATSKGSFELGKLTVLIDEGSASASEIVSGAVQDWDRAVIIGRRSFGKGLVQEPYLFADGSGMRLTVARYYTPAGRSIQKPYSHGIESYQDELERRFEHGEFTNPDSIVFADSLKYTTSGGRTVFGGGGIMPDVFVPLDTSDNTSYLAEVVGKGLVNQYALNYSDRNRQQLEENYSTLDEFISGFELTEAIMNDFTRFASAEDVEFNLSQYELSKDVLKAQIKALIARQYWRNEGFYKVINRQNKAYNEAIKIIQKDDFRALGIREN